MQETLNIVELIENNPIAKISSAYNSKLLLKIQESFTGFEQQLFISNFYCYLNYDCIIDLKLITLADENGYWFDTAEFTLSINSKN
jgi:hypothetical protein